MTDGIPLGLAIYSAFAELLKFVVKEDFVGACHDTSAVLHMLLAENNVPSELCIGEVGVGSRYFDHSWVEVLGSVFDVAVCMPDYAGEPVGGPVFDGIDLAQGRPSELVYGAESGEGLGLAAQPALSLDLEGFAAIQPQLNIWVLAVAIAGRAGMANPTFTHFQLRYGAVRRRFRKNPT
ncbi:MULTISPECIES: hypothetical protein [Ramlibacter]|uniref:Microcin J25-processing protein McjB C-terminal domain-containing protein n=1 Tax=Ramlibacter pinisoli TaxID=2682844 RepID=A0A6N8IMG4_9BURK|nr:MULTISPECIES: hypothetical protein [Ramlibacter]MBA2960711.1 hypothetical protein [Ramlibacter sp. CGMCC 1.13660]MVQ28039.1 hypothetical protein [Ramlibacter pinisoli]